MPSDAEPEEYGPAGYLPERAAKRARKIVLREQMGMGWPLAAVMAGFGVLIVGVVFLVAATGPPAAPFAAAGLIDAVDPRGAEVLATPEVGRVLVVRAGGAVRAFEAPEAPIAHCIASGRLEAEDGSVWNLNGRLLGGPGPSLALLPSEVHDGVVYVDPTNPLRSAPARELDAEPECFDAE